MTNAQRNEEEDGWPFDMPWDDEETAAPVALDAPPVAIPPGDRTPNGSGAPDPANADRPTPLASEGEPSTVGLLQQTQQTIDDLLAYVAELEAERTEQGRLRVKAAQTIDALMAQMDRTRQERDAERAAREEEDAEHLAELDEHRRRLTWLEREHEKCAEVKLMMERQIGRLEDQLRACQEGRLPACTEGKENGEMVPVDEGALRVLGQKAAQTEHMRARYQYMAAAETDERFKPGQKATMAALVDLCGAPPAPGTYTTPRKVCRAAIAQRTGQAPSTISKQVPDLANIGVLKLERRPVTKERASDDPDGRPIRRTEEEWWVSLGPLPPKSVPKEEIQAKCTHAHAEAERKKRCPGCGHTTLQATNYHCTSCGRTCAAAEAQAAGERFDELPDGAIVDLLTGEKLAPLFASSPANGNGHARTKARRRGRARPHPDSGGGVRHTTIVHPDRIPDGVPLGGTNGHTHSREGTAMATPIRIPDGATSGGGHAPAPTTASPYRNPDGGHATTPPCTPTGIRMGSMPPSGEQRGGGAHGQAGPAGPSPPS